MTTPRKLMTIRTSNPRDFEVLVEIQNESLTAARWRSEDYARLAATAGGVILVAESEPDQNTEMIGFAAASHVADEAELKNIAVRPSQQRRGVGKALMLELHQRLLEAGANRIYLEVRSSNAPALELYRSLGYDVRYQRQKYYQDPPEDALVLCLELLPSEV